MLKGRDLKFFAIGALMVASGLSVLAAVNIPHTFAPGTPIKATEVNANFSSLKAALEELDSAKQTKISGSPCQSGQFVRGIATDGKMECGVDQVGSGGSAGVASLNGKTGSLALEAGANLTLDNSQDGKIILNAAGGGLNLPTKLEGTNPNTGNALLMVTTKDIGSAIYGISNDPSSSAVGVQGDTSSPGGFGVYGLSRLDGSGTGVYGQGGIGVWGSTTAQTTKGYGVYGENNSSAGYGVFGKAGKGIAGVHGETSNTSGSGVEGSADGGNAAGVFGVNPSGPGVWGRSSTSVALKGESTSGYGVHAVTETGLAAVYGANTKNTSGSGVEGRGNGSNAAGVYGVNPTGPGVWGRSTSGTGGYFESDSSYAIQGKTRFTALSVESTQNTAAIVTTRGTGVSALIINQWGSGNIITGRDVSNAEVFRVLNDGSVFSKTNSYTSDRHAKTNIKSLDVRAVLQKVAAMPISSWNYKSDAQNVQHVGPMAQDFHAAFGLNGSDDKHINTVDAQGVALAAIQGLNHKLETLEIENTALRSQLAALEARLSKLEKH